LTETILPLAAADDAIVRTKASNTARFGLIDEWHLKFS
jgi:hypothetical protein